MVEALEAMDGLVKAGKIRQSACPTRPLGHAEMLRIAEARGLPRMASIQNEYGLLCRLFDIDLAELASARMSGCWPIRRSPPGC